MQPNELHKSIELLHATPSLQVRHATDITNLASKSGFNHFEFQVGKMLVRDPQVPAHSETAKNLGPQSVFAVYGFGTTLRDALRMAILAGLSTEGFHNVA